MTNSGLDGGWHAPGHVNLRCVGDNASWRVDYQSLDHGIALVQNAIETVKVSAAKNNNDERVNAGSNEAAYG